MPVDYRLDLLGMNLQAADIDDTAAAAGEDEVVEAAKAAYVDRFVHTLPNGYDTVVSDDGGNISAGEKQLITIAREASVRALDTELAGGDPESNGRREAAEDLTPAAASAAALDCAKRRASSGGALTKLESASAPAGNAGSAASTAAPAQRIGAESSTGASRSSPRAAPSAFS